jgi:hypothetical protein
MESDLGFKAFSQAIKTDPIGLLFAQWRRDYFVGQLMKVPGVARIIQSGSLARGTQIGPVHDVDLIVVFDPDVHPGFAIKGTSTEAQASAQAAIAYLEAELIEQLHPGRESDGGGLLKETEQRRHVVNYNDNWLGPFKGFIPSAPPVDVMPAVQEGTHLLIPERGTGWIEADPEWLIRAVEERQRQWKYFTKVVGMVKAWAKLNDLEMKNLAIEVMVLQHCPRPRLFQTLSVGEAVAQFFEAAAQAGVTSLTDPTGWCKGEIDPNLNFRKLGSALDAAAGLAREAMEAEHAWKNRRYAEAEVTHPDVFWRQLFGKKYPRTRERFLRPARTEPWFGRFTTEPVVSANVSPPNRRNNPKPKGPAGGGGPRDPDDRDPNGQHGRRPNGLGGGSPQKPRSRTPGGPDATAAKSSDGDARDPRRSARQHRGGPQRSSATRSPRRRSEAASGQPIANYWDRVFGPAVATVPVPLTFG